MSAADAPTAAVDVPMFAAGQRSVRRVSTRFLRSELMLIFGRRRNWAGLGVLASVPIIIATAVKLSGGPQAGEGPDFLAAITDNGFFVALTALVLELPLFLPLAVAAISADTIAGEANLGTLRYLLAVPVRRSRMLAVKYAAVAIFAFAATLLVALVGLLVGLALFGGGPVTLLSGAQGPSARRCCGCSQSARTWRSGWPRSARWACSSRPSRSSRSERPSRS